MAIITIITILVIELITVIMVITIIIMEVAIIVIIAMIIDNSQDNRIIMAIILNIVRIRIQIAIAKQRFS